MPLPTLTVFDIETTGLDSKKGHRIIEIAAMKITNGVIDEAGMFHTMVNPERDIPVEAKQIHRITEADLVNAPTIMTALPQFLEFAQGTVLLAHNASFDFGFLQTEKEFCWGYIELPECLCTLQLSRTLFPQEFRHNLDALCQRFGIVPPAVRHRARTDVLLTCQALLKMIEHGRIQNIEDLRRKASIMQMASR